MLASISSNRDATVITLIHRQETMSFLGFPLMRHIDIDDSESVLKAIRGTPPGRTIEIILHTPGGLVLAATQIALALADHDGRVVAVVPHYAMSGGTLIALAADEIVIDRHAALLRQVEVVVTRLLEAHMPKPRARELAHLLSSGVWTHDHPLMAAELEQLGLPVKFGVPDEERTLMNLYPQPRGRQDSVEAFPEAPLVPGLPPGREGPRRGRTAPAGARSQRS
jgi:hypothetical protein